MAPGPIARPHRPWRTAFLTGMASFLDAGSLTASGTSISVLYVPSFHLTPAVIGLVLGCQQFSFAIGAFFGGRLGDRFGRRTVLTVALVGFIVGMAVLAGASEKWELFAGAVLVGLGIGADLPVALSMANEVAPKSRKGRAVVLASVMWTLGIFAVQLGVSVVGDRGVTGGRILFGSLAGIALLLLLSRLVLPESAEWLAARRDLEAARGNHGDSQPLRLNRLGQVFRSPVVWTVLALALYYTAWNVGASTNGKYASYIWTHLAGGNVETYARISLINLPLSIIASVLFVLVVDSKRRRLWTAIGTLLIIVGWAPLAFFGASQNAMLGVMFLFVVGSCLAGEPLYKVWSQELVPTLLRGTAQGVTMGFSRIVAAVLAFILPVLLTTAPALVFIGIFCFAAVSGLVWLLWMPRLPRAEDIEQPALVISDAREVPSGTDRVEA